MILRAGDPGMHDNVLDAAEVCFDRRGWSKTTMDNVAAVAGISRGYIYKHFRNRDGLKLAVLVRRADAFNNKARPFIAAQPTISDKLIEGIMLGVNMAHRDHYFGRLVGASTTDPEFQVTGARDAAVKKTDELWRPFLDEAAELNELGSGVLVDDVVDWILIVMLGLLANKVSMHATDADIERQLRVLFVPSVVSAAALTHHRSRIASATTV
jgi:AcrR family transcriptional regulator